MAATTARDLSGSISGIKVPLAARDVAEASLLPWGQANDLSSVPQRGGG